VERLRFSTVNHPRRRRGPPGLAALGGWGAINGLAVGFGVFLLTYLATGLNLWLFVLLGWSTLGMDRVLRGHPSGQFRGIAATAIYLFVPVLFTVGSAVFLREVSSGIWNLLAATLAAVLFALAAHAEYVTVDATPESYPPARTALSLVSYLTAFALYTTVFTSDLPLALATLVVMLTSLLLTVDILREMEMQTGTLFAYAAGVAAVVAELRLAMYYLPPGDLVAGALLLLTFYELTGLTQSYLSGHLNRRTVLEYTGFGLVCLAIITVTWVLSRSA
jgi:hypothetical protein